MNKQMITTITTGVLITVIGGVLVYKLKASGILGKPACEHSGQGQV
ncbi:hypothetical protein [Pseudoteredinibacter isoporae]